MIVAISERCSQGTWRVVLSIEDCIVDDVE